jgi:large subunit ribosomal protein L35
MYFRSPILKESIMPKMKSHSSAKKRFKVTGSGKIMAYHAFKNHILTKKSKKRKRALGRYSVIAQVDAPRVARLLTAH